ncbi:hypothetical protein CGH83_22975 [Vibrio parahaemolyticus]|nr:hypothetical protein CGH83_22975 [Vibrio parahaemolyticus]
MSYNKAFKADSQRVAFLVLVGFSVYGGMVKFSGSVAHYLTRRYVNGVNLENISCQKWSDWGLRS